MKSHPNSTSTNHDKDKFIWIICNIGPLYLVILSFNHGSNYLKVLALEHLKKEK